MNNNDQGWLRTVSLTPPTLQDNTADVDRLVRALKNRLETDAIDVDLNLLRRLPDLFRKWNYNVCCVLFKDRQRWLLTNVTSSQNANSIAGLAVDLGTSRVDLRLLNLATGQSLAESSFNNPQLSVGPDILTRIHFADQEGGLERLNKLIVNGLNRMISELCRSVNLETDDIHLMSVPANESRHRRRPHNQSG